jgi:hypothetical protein
LHLVGFFPLHTLLVKLLIYKTTIKPIWTYGTEIWGCASKSSQAIPQKAQSKILRMITNAPRYVSNLTLHEGLKIAYVREVTFEKYANHHRKLETYPNPLLYPLLDTGQPRRLKRTQPVDLPWGSRGSVIGRGLIMSHDDRNALPLSAHYLIRYVLFWLLINFKIKKIKKLLCPRCTVTET